MSRLTKRQKKGIAFRERKHLKRKDDPLDTLEDKVDVASFDDQVLVDGTQDQQSPQADTEPLVWKRKARTKGEETKAGRMVVAGEKRKRTINEKEEGEPEPGPKRRRGTDGGCPDGVEPPVESHVSGEAGKESEKAKQRFILFLGNLKYTTTVEAIQAHFSVCVPPPIVRLLTPKPPMKSPTKPLIKSRGCAFLEFGHRGALQQGLKLHHSQLEGRQINVELTAGGGGKGEARMKKLKKRNEELEGQRRKLKGPGDEAQFRSTQRFPATPSAEENHAYNRRIETTGDIEQKQTHHADDPKHQRRSKKRTSIAKDFRTGVNAIPIG